MEPAHSPRNRPAILIVIGSLGLGGTERHLAQVLPYLVAQGWPIAVYTLTEAGVLAPELEAAGVRIIAPPSQRPWAQLSRPRRIARLALRALGLLKVVRRLRPQIVHYFLPQAYLLGGAALWFCRPQIEVMSRRSLNAYQRKKPLFARLEQRLHRRMTAILGNSEAVLAELAEEPGMRRDQLVLIRNGVDTARFAACDRAKARQRLGLASEAFIMVIVANLIPYKGHGDLIDALAHVRSSLPSSWRLLCVGRDDGIGSVLEERAKQLGLGDNISWLGERNDVADMLAAADIGILCSHEEGFSNAILEGMAAGLPMIVTDVGGNREAMTDGVTGLIVPSRAPQKLGEAIVTLANDPALRKAMSKASRERAVKRFSLESCITDYNQFYGLLVEGKPVSNFGLKKDEDTTSVVNDFRI